MLILDYRHHLSYFRSAPADFAVEFFSSLDIDREVADASPAQREAMAALVIARGRFAPLLVAIHHHADGRVNWPALATCMARLLTTPADLTRAHLDEVYEHLDAHYRALGILAPAPGAKTGEQAYDLALEGRIALLDDNGDAWLYAEPHCDARCRYFPRFRAVSGSATKLGPRPLAGAMADPAAWGRWLPSRGRWAGATE